MSRKKPAFILLGLEFATKDSVREHMRALVARWPPDSTIVGQDRDFILELARYHPQPEKKIGCGILRLYRGGASPVAPQIMIERIDGSVDDLSWQTCISPPSAYTKFCEALRRGVVDQCVLFKLQQLGAASPPLCRYGGVPLDASNSVVHHPAPNTFKNLTARFLLKYQLDWQKVETVSPPGVAGRIICDPTIRSLWVAFHEQHATLALISRTAHDEIDKYEQDPSALK
jgi:hypothetical protein